VAVQEVRWIEGGSQPADDFTFLYANGNANHHLGIGFVIHKGIISEFVNDRMLYTITGHWEDIIVLNVHAQTEDTKNCFCEELEFVFDQFPKYDLKMLLGNFNSNVPREDIFKPAFGNEIIQEINTDNLFRAVNFAISKHLIVKSTMLPHHNIHKYA
jgi:hypothetical protein